MANDFRVLDQQAASLLREVLPWLDRYGQPAQRIVAYLQANDKAHETRRNK